MYSNLKLGMFFSLKTLLFQVINTILGKWKILVINKVKEAGRTLPTNFLEVPRPSPTTSLGSERPEIQPLVGRCITRTPKTAGNRRQVPGGRRHLGLMSKRRQKRATSWEFTFLQI